jgi:cytochrome c oxidase subunit IV
MNAAYESKKLIPEKKTKQKDIEVYIMIWALFIKLSNSSKEKKAQKMKVET